MERQHLRQGDQVWKRHRSGNTTAAFVILSVHGDSFWEGMELLAETATYLERSSTLCLIRGWQTQAVFVNVVFHERSVLLLQWARARGAQRALKYLLSGPLKRKFADPGLKYQPFKEATGGTTDMLY